MIVGEILELLLRPAHLVLRDAEALEIVLRMPPHIPDGDAAFLCQLADEPDQLAAALLGERGEGKPDDVPVVRGIQPEIRFDDGSLDLR